MISDILLPRWRWDQISQAIELKVVKEQTRVNLLFFSTDTDNLILFRIHFFELKILERENGILDIWWNGNGFDWNFNAFLMPPHPWKYLLLFSPQVESGCKMKNSWNTDAVWLPLRGHAYYLSQTILWIKWSYIAMTIYLHIFIVIFPSFNTDNSSHQSQMIN